MIANYANVLSAAERASHIRPA